MELFARAYVEAQAAGKPMDSDYIAPGPPGDGYEGRLFRLRTGIERVLLTEAEASTGAPPYQARAQVPVLIERLGNHSPDGANVIYMDGHVEFIRYPGKWPMTEKTVRILNELDALGEAVTVR